MKSNTTSIILLAAAAGAGYYFYNKQKKSKELASKVAVEEDKEENKEEDKKEDKPSSYGTPSGYGSSPAYATASAPSLVKTSTSAPKQKLTIVEKFQKAKALYNIVRRKKGISGFNDMLSNQLTSSRSSGSKKHIKHSKNVHYNNAMHHYNKKNKNGFDHCIGLF